MWAKRGGRTPRQIKLTTSTRCKPNSSAFRREGLNDPSRPSGEEQLKTRGGKEKKKRQVRGTTILSSKTGGEKTSVGVERNGENRKKKGTANSGGRGEKKKEGRG